MPQPQSHYVGEGNIRVENKVYSADKLAELHPGGPMFIQAFNGRDASQAFLTYHRRQFPHSRAEKAFQKVDDTVQYTAKDNQDFLELCERVDKILPRYKAFAGWLFYAKALTILALAFGLELYVHLTGHYDWYFMAPLGLLLALIGLNVQHDANHGAISRRPWINRIFGVTQNYIGGSTVSWIHQHVVQHHIHTNDVHLDPDINIEFYIRLNPTHPLLQFHMFQYIYFFFLAALFGAQKMISSVGDIFTWHHYTPMAMQLKPYAWVEYVATASHVLRWLILPAVNLAPGGLLNAYSCVFLMLCIEGWYLSFFFTISHNFDGVAKHEATTRDTNANQSFLYNQVAASSNVAGFWLAVLNGGLNYQIEHHLFPRVNHTHYHKIAPIVREFCLEKNIPYTHFPTVKSNVDGLVQHLFDLGKQENANPLLQDPTAKSSSRMPLIS